MGAENSTPEELIFYQLPTLHRDGTVVRSSATHTREEAFEWLLKRIGRNYTNPSKSTEVLKTIYKVMGLEVAKHHAISPR